MRYPTSALPIQNTWNSFACDMNETIILDAARRIVDLGFKDLGYEYIVMDDCWSAGRNSSGYLVHDKKKFPNGIAHVANKIHELGLKVGIYSSAGSMTCARYEGSLGYEQKDADVWASWGIDYLKYDNCYNEGQEGTPKLSYDRYNAMSKALNSTGRPIVYSMCNWGVDGPWNFATTISNSWRTSGDLINVWNQDDPNCPCSEKEGLDCKSPGYHCSIMNVLNMAAFMPSKAYAGAWNDLDLLRGRKRRPNRRRIHLPLQSLGSRQIPPHDEQHHDPNRPPNPLHPPKPRRHRHQPRPRVCPRYPPLAQIPRRRNRRIRKEGRNPALQRLAQRRRPSHSALERRHQNPRDDRLPRRNLLGRRREGHCGAGF